MELGGTFDSDKYEPTSFDTVPAGKYRACITASTIKNASQSANRYLELEVQILDGEYKGRKIWDRIHLWNDNPKAVQIAGGTLSAICRAVGRRTINDSSEVHNLPLVIAVKVRKQEGYSDSNEIAAYYAAQPTNQSANQFPGGPPQQQQFAPSQPAQPAQQANPFA